MRTLGGGSRMATQYTITDGPSKWDLMLALFDPASHQRTVKFYLQDRRFFEASILEVGKEDGSGESWLLAGSLKEAFEGGGSGCRWYFHAYFETQRRKGWIKFFQTINEMRLDGVSHLLPQ